MNDIVNGKKGHNIVNDSIAHKLKRLLVKLISKLYQENIGRKVWS